jgi:DNA-binding transcriptional ArsR family regulator
VPEEHASPGLGPRGRGQLPFPGRALPEREAGGDAHPDQLARLGDIAAQFDVTWSAVSQHLRIRNTDRNGVLYSGTTSQRIDGISTDSAGRMLIVLPALLPAVLRWCGPGRIKIVLPALLPWF